MRSRIYATSADRQRAYRARQSEPTTRASHTQAAKPRRPPSRPSRLAVLASSLQVLQAEYEAWLEALPESMSDGDLAERLRETIEQLGAAADLVAEIEPPRGFGRD